MMEFGSSDEIDSPDEADAEGEEPTNGHSSDAESDLSDDELFEREFTLHKRNYYITKLKYPEMTE